MGGSPQPEGSISKFSTRTVSIWGTHENLGNLVGAEIQVSDLAPLEVNFFAKAIAESHRDPSLNLHAGAIGIDHGTHVLSMDNTFHLNAATASCRL